MRIPECIEWERLIITIDGRWLIIYNKERVLEKTKKRAVNLV